jgi:hypothetical protein
MSALIDFPLRTHRGAALGALPRSRRAVVPASPELSQRSAVGLLAHAQAGVAEAQREPLPAQRYALAYLAALRAAAAMLALRGRPHRGRARPASAWALLATLAPELREWAEFFAAGSATRAAVQAGITRMVSQRAADDLVRQAAQFADLVGDAVYGRGLFAARPAENERGQR